METPIKSLLVVACLAALCGVPRASAVQLYNQSYDGLSNFVASQNDTTGGNGNYATTYDNFTLGSSSNINNVMFTGGFFNPSSPGTITSFTISFWANSAGAPGGLLQSFSVAGNGSQMSIGGGVYTYSLNLGSAFTAVAGTQYWLSIVPNLGYPPQWGWATSAGGDGGSVQDFFGSRSGTSYDMAFTLNGSPVGVPDSGETVLLLGGAVMGLGFFLRRSNLAAVRS